MSSVYPAIRDLADYRPLSRRVVQDAGAADDNEINLDKLATELSRNRLNEIAELVRSLTYGEMIELGDGLWGKLPELQEGQKVKPKDFPKMLHLWSTGGERK